MPRPDASQGEAPYFDALRAYAARNPGRFHVPGHKGASGADPELREALGEALAIDIPALMPGIDAGPEPTPFQTAQELAAKAWGARRSWFLINGASQGNHVACLALAHMGDQVVVQRNVHSSTIDGSVLAGLRPTFVAPELDPELLIAHSLTPESLDRALSEAPAAVAAQVVDEAWGAHLAFSDELPAHALSLGADLVISSTHKILGSLTQSAILHLGRGDRLDEAVIDRRVNLVESP